MSRLDFNKPKKIRSTEEHNKMHQSSAEAAGTYVPNMSEKDTKKWKAKHIKGSNERIEIRKTLEGTNLVIIVRKNNPKPAPKYTTNCNYTKYQIDLKKYFSERSNIKISANGPIWLSFFNMIELNDVIEEAKEIMLK